MADPPRDPRLSLSQAAELSRLFHEHGPRLRAMVGRRLGPALARWTGAEDLVAEVFLRAGRRWPPPEKMQTYPWLYRIALDCLAEARRRDDRGGLGPEHRVPWPDGSAAELGSKAEGTGTSPERAAQRAEAAEKVHAALDRLDKNDREILWMRTVDGLKFQEVASVLEITAEAAAKRYARALERLKDALPNGLGAEGGTP